MVLPQLCVYLVPCYCTSVPALQVGGMTTSFFICRIIFFPDFSVYSRPKELKSLYIDTTFCVPAALFIPSRDESSNAVIAIAEEWISQSRNHMVVIKYKALLGYEDLFRRLAEHFSTKVCVESMIFYLPLRFSSEISKCHLSMVTKKATRLVFTSPDSNFLFTTLLFIGQRISAIFGNTFM